MRLHERYQLAQQAAEDPDAGLANRVKATVLLESEGDLLAGIVHRQGWMGSQVIVVANGCFLLNLPLVNHQHRQLAGA